MWEGLVDYALVSRPGNDQIQLALFADDAPGAEIHLLDGGHFRLESQLTAVSQHTHRFLRRTLT